MKVLKWIILGLGSLFLLWIFGILFKVFGLVVAVFGTVLSAVTAAVFNKIFWFFAISGVIIFLVARNSRGGLHRGGHSRRGTSGMAPADPHPHAGDDYFQKVGNMDRRLDRLNDILSRHQ